MFDASDPADLAALKSEVETDPIGQDYASAQGGSAIVLGKLNDPGQNSGGESINRLVGDLQVPEIAGVIDEAEYASLNEYQKEWVKMFIAQSADVTLRQFVEKFTDIFDGSQTLIDALALRDKLASRAEVLFGVNSIITRQSLGAALRLP